MARTAALWRHSGVRIARDHSAFDAAGCRPPHRTTVILDYCRAGCRQSAPP